MSLCIISDNCWGAGVYQSLKLEYNTPFVGVLIHTPDYVRLLENFIEYMALPLQETNFDKSKYRHIPHPLANYTITGLLGDIEIMFPHYSSFSMALDKWNRRKSRMTSDLNQIVVKIGPITVEKNIHVNYGNNLRYYERFYAIPHFKKISFTEKSYDFPNNYVLKPIHQYDAITGGLEWAQYQPDLWAGGEIGIHDGFRRHCFIA